MERHRYAPPFRELNYGHTLLTLIHVDTNINLEQRKLLVFRKEQVPGSHGKILPLVYWYFPALQLMSIASDPETLNLQQQPGNAFIVCFHHLFVDSSKTSSSQQGTSQFSSRDSCQPLSPGYSCPSEQPTCLPSCEVMLLPSTFRFAADILHLFTYIAGKVGRLGCPQHQSVPEEHQC